MTRIDPSHRARGAQSRINVTNIASSSRPLPQVQVPSHIWQPRATHHYPARTGPQATRTGSTLNQTSTYPTYPHHGSRGGDRLRACKSSSANPNSHSTEALLIHASPPSSGPSSSQAQAQNTREFRRDTSRIPSQSLSNNDANPCRFRPYDHQDVRRSDQQQPSTNQISDDNPFIDPAPRQPVTRSVTRVRRDREVEAVAWPSREVGAPPQHAAHSWVNHDQPLPYPSHISNLIPTHPELERLNEQALSTFERRYAYATPTRNGAYVNREETDPFSPHDVPDVVPNAHLRRQKRVTRRHTEPIARASPSSSMFVNGSDRHSDDDSGEDRRPVAILQGRVRSMQLAPERLVRVPVAPQTQRKNSLPCSICLDAPEEFPSLRPTSRCEHEPTICTTCLGEYISHAILSEGSTTLSCPEPDCRQAMERSDIVRGVGNNLACVDRYEALLLRREQEKDPNFVWCKNAVCDWGQIHKKGANAPIVVCQACRARSCFTHEVPWHNGLTCKQYNAQIAKQRAAEDGANQVYLNRYVKTCPNTSCGRRIEKSEGCDHMTCRRPAGCGHEFCWICLADYRIIFQEGGHRHATSCQHYVARNQNYLEIDPPDPDFHPDPAPAAPTRRVLQRRTRLERMGATFPRRRTTPAPLVPLFPPPILPPPRSQTWWGSLFGS